MTIKDVEKVTGLTAKKYQEDAKVIEEYIEKSPRTRCSRTFVVGIAVWNQSSSSSSLSSTS